MLKYNEKTCITCQFLFEGYFLKFRNVEWNLYGRFNCQTKNLVYLIICTKENCLDLYVGETEKTLDERLRQHIGYIVNKKINRPRGKHC